MATHTPGPWEAYSVDGAGWSVRRTFPREGHTGLAPICSMAWFQFDIPGIIDDEISGANARLIASAPDLLVALKTTTAALRYALLNNGETPLHSQVVKMADLAIAKATA